MQNKLISEADVVDQTRLAQGHATKIRLLLSWRQEHAGALPYKYSSDEKEVNLAFWLEKVSTGYLFMSVPQKQQLSAAGVDLQKVARIEQNNQWLDRIENFILYNDGKLPAGDGLGKREREITKWLQAVRQGKAEPLTPPQEQRLHKLGLDLYTVPIDNFWHFIEHGGFFPVVAADAKHEYVFCRANAGHSGRDKQITVLRAGPQGDWYYKGEIAKLGLDICNPAMYIFPDEKILLVVCKHNIDDLVNLCDPDARQSVQNSGLLLLNSQDGGVSWTENTEVNFGSVYEQIGMVSPHGRMLKHQDLLLLPVYNKTGSYLLASADAGENWRVFSKIAADLQEPSVIETPEHGLVAALRYIDKNTWYEKNKTFISRYVDGQWSAPTAVTENQQDPADLLVLSNGNLLLTYSDRKLTKQRILVKTSRDSGASWSAALQIGQSFRDCDFGSPSTIEFPAGILTTVFYANPVVEHPHFDIRDMLFYKDADAKGYYYQYPMDILD
jgi:hypothetical protein